MRSILFNTALAVTAMAVVTHVGVQLDAQQKGGGAPPAIKMFASSTEVAAIIAKSKADRKEQPLISTPLIQLSPIGANLEYRASVGAAAVHESEAEMFYVIDGSATLVTGGKMVDEKRTNATNLTGTGIEGGATRQIAKGDFVIVPENTPHWFSPINGVLVLMSVHIPRPLPVAAK